MASSVSGQVEQIACCDWLLEQARWSYLTCLGLPAVLREKNSHEGQIANPLLAKLFQSRWLDIRLVLFYEFMDLDSISVHKHVEKNLASVQPS